MIGDLREATLLLGGDAVEIEVRWVGNFGHRAGTLRAKKLGFGAYHAQLVESTAELRARAPCPCRENSLKYGIFLL